MPSRLSFVLLTDSAVRHVVAGDRGIGHFNAHLDQLVAGVHELAVQADLAVAEGELVDVVVLVADGLAGSADAGFPLAVIGGVGQDAPDNGVGKLMDIPQNTAPTMMSAVLVLANMNSTPLMIRQALPMT